MAQLERARAQGFLGPGPVAAHVEHAAAFVHALAGVQGTVVDLGSGSGVPGLIVAEQRPDLQIVLVETTAKRCRFLEAAVVTLGLSAVVVQGRAEEVGRSTRRGSVDAVIARSFGAPGPTAECAAPLLRVGGQLVVSEPPDHRPERWPEAGLAQLGMTCGARSPAAPHLQVLHQTATCPDAFPRSVGLPAKRPLF